MATEHDLSDLLPPDPPPRPARREEAIGAALRRFDGVAEPERTPVPVRGWWVTRRPQLGGLVAVALIAAVGLPLWLSGDPTPHKPSNAQVAERPTPSTAESSTSTSVSGLPGDVATSQVPGIVATDPSASVAAPREKPLADVMVDSEPAAPPPAPPPPPPSAPAAAFAAADEASASGDIVVTSSRISNRAERARLQLTRRFDTAGAWNACTVADPRRSLARCRSDLRLGAAGVAGQSGALVGEGLSRAWQGNTDAAIAAFDRALELSPRSPSAWLNRGIANALAGDDERALADLDKAVRYAPTDARALVQRSMVLRRAGKVARAESDATRAVQLDPSVRELFE